MGNRGQSAAPLDTNATERDAESPAQLEPKIARFSHRCAQQKQQNNGR